MEYTAIPVDTVIARIDWITSTTFNITPLQRGLTTINVGATDAYTAAVGTFFRVSVIDLVNAVETPEGSSLTAVPNPFNNQLTLTFESQSSGPITVLVHDILGNVVWQREEGISVPGIHTFTIDGSNLASGMYVCRLIKDGDLVGALRIVRK